VILGVRHWGSDISFNLLPHILNYIKILKIKLHFSLKFLYFPKFYIKYPFLHSYMRI
jgi:hypothetical protein